ncbi:hypothetical protein F5148DRAFT_72810 [Russula earlei]|uniref:Uncharacterized protein n=1 Tax=Russula earlei TaxID=71964 RepID=A0ACC0U855_9AGAM|nr:hypothetical protein F5148DRAFT_72810 [Russula earlei]
MGCAFAGCRRFFRESTLHYIAHPRRHGLAEPRGQRIRAGATTPESITNPQPLSWRYSWYLAYGVYFPIAVPFPASPSSGSPSDPHESSLQFGAHPFTSSPDIWPSHSVGMNVSASPVTSTLGVATSLGENKGKGVMRRSPSESTRGSSRYDPVGRQSRVTPRSAAASEPLTDEGEEERDSDGSVRDVRDKKRRYAKTFRDIEKQLFEKLRHRLFPQDPHAKRSECLERGGCLDIAAIGPVINHFFLWFHAAIESVDELLQLRENEARRHKEIEDLRQQLTDAERRIERLYRELNGRSLTMGS